MSEEQERQRKQSALETLVSAARVAQKRGAYSLEEAAAIFTAINEFSEAPQSEEKSKVFSSPQDTNQNE
jgi:hypothetical protein